MAESSNEYSTTIGPDAFIKGELQFEKGVRLLGKFEGQITSKGSLLLAEGSKVSGEVHAGNIRVDGEVKGNLNAETKIQLSASGRLEGDLRASKLEVAEGATLSGRCLVGPNGKMPSAAPSRPQTPPGQTQPTPAGGKPRPGEEGRK